VNKHEEDMHMRKIIRIPKCESEGGVSRHNKRGNMGLCALNNRDEVHYGKEK